MHRANERISIGALRVQRQVLADINTWDIGSNRPELAANLVWGVGLEVIRLGLRRTAGQPQEDDRTAIGVGNASRFGL